MLNPSDKIAAAVGWKPQTLGANTDPADPTSSVGVEQLQLVMHELRDSISWSVSTPTISTICSTEMTTDGDVDAGEIHSVDSSQVICSTETAVRRLSKLVSCTLSTLEPRCPFKCHVGPLRIGTVATDLAPTELVGLGSICACAFV